MKLASLALLVCVVGGSFSLTPEHIEEWQLFKTKHQKVYGSRTETDRRFKIFVDNLAKIQKHNQQYEEGKHTYKMGVNQFTDLLHSEFLDMMTVELPPYRGEEYMISEKALQELMSKEADETVDWRTKGAVNPAKQQGGCGSCFTFSVTGALEGAHFVKTGKLVDLSEQNLLDCGKGRKYDLDCRGGWPYKAFKYIFDNGGLATEESYPYEANDNGPCQYNASKVGATITGHVVLPAKDEEALKKALSTIGPISIVLNAEGFAGYHSGIISTGACKDRPLNHAVLAVGYGTEDGVDYWLIRNSWGPRFGEEGYIRIARNQNNLCGVASACVYPTV